jgi:hypothetical protein
VTQTARGPRALCLHRAEGDGDGFSYAYEGRRGRHPGGLDGFGPWAEAEAVRVGGHAGNAPLVVAAARGPAPVYVYRPVDLHGLDPLAALADVRAYPGRPLHGYRVRPADARAFALAAGTGALRDHPAWPAVSFVPWADLAAAADVLRALGDPRWFVDPSRPGRVATLVSYFGVADALRPREAPEVGPRAARRRAVFAAWRGPDATPRPGHPRGYFWRLAASRPGPKGLVRASTAYLRFVREVWLQAAHGPSRELFDPAAFFRGEPETADAYRRHALAEAPPE